MNRLTQKRDDSYVVINGEFHNIGEHINKLGELEDIEEEAGCLIAVMFKAQKQGYIFTREFGVLKGFVVFDFKLKRIQIAVNCDFGNVYTFYIADYKNTWWLKEDKSE